MYKQVDQKWKENIYKNRQCAMNIYIDDVLINPDYILDFKKGGDVFDEELALGSTPSQYIEMKLYKNKISTIPKKIKVEYGILINYTLTVAEVNSMLVGTLNGIPVKSLSTNNSSFEMIPIGIYNVDDYTDNDDSTITIKSLDNMIKFEFNYDGSTLVNEKGYATLLEVAQDICNKAGVELGSTSFLNSEKQIAVYDNTITAREYISYIAESAGCFACIGRDGKLYFRAIGEDETGIPLEMFGEYKWGEEFQISKVSYEDGIRSFKFGDDTRNNLWINQDNMFIVDEEQVQNIYNKVKGLTINSFEGKTVIDPCVDIGDKIIIDGKTVIYQGEMTLEGRFIAQISSKIQIKQKEETTVKKESQKVVNRRVQSEINQLDGKITQLAEETSEYSEKLTKHEQTIDSIKDSVHKLEDFTRTITETNQIHLNETAKGQGYILEFKIKGNTEYFKYLVPSDNLVPSDTLVPLGGHFTLVCDKQPRTSKSSEAVEIDVILNNPLRNLGEIYDELNIIDSKTTVTRRIGVKNDGSLYILDKAVTETLQNVKLTTFDSNTYVYIKEYSGLEYTAKYIVKNDYSDKFVTKLEADTKIEQKADSIELGVNKKLESYSTTEEMNSAIQLKADSITNTVSKKVGNDEIISKINQSAEAVGIDANKIELSANDILNLLAGNAINLGSKNITIKSDNFNVDKEGNVIANNANINGGKIVLTAPNKDTAKITVKNSDETVYTEMSAGGIKTIYDNKIIFWFNGSVSSIASTNGKRCLFAGNSINIEDSIPGSGNYPISLSGDNGNITCISLTQTSLAEKKKNFEKLQDNALDILKQIDIYKYNLKGEKDTDKKHIGFVIGDGYNYAKEVTSLDNQGVDNYSFTSLCCKAIQEQQEQIEQMQKRIEIFEKEAENGQNNI